MDNRMKKIGKHCRIFRLNVLELTLKDIQGNENIKSLSSFEHGKSTNIKHLFKYVNACNNQQQKIDFLQQLIYIIESE